MPRKRPPADLITAWEIIAGIRQGVRYWGDEARHMRERGADGEAAVLEACIAELKKDVDAWDNRRQ